jgi:hypothetical protein
MEADSSRSATDKLFANPNRPPHQKKPRSTLKLPIPKNNATVLPLESVNDKLCQLSYAPATQTTVVTTTTTTTTAFPPFLMKAPRNLAERDSKNYPLASKPTPDALKRFTFDLGGQIACFEEAADVDSAMNEVSTYGRTHKPSAPPHRSRHCPPEPVFQPWKFYLISL